MRAAWLLLGSLLLTGVLQAQQRVERTFQLDADGAVRIYALTGSVTVRGWEREAVVIRGDLGVGNRFHGGGGRGGVKMFVEADDDRQPQPARLEVFVPTAAKVWIKTATAEISVSGVSGSVDAYVIGGSIRVSGNPSELNAEAIDGSIEISGAPGWVRAKSASGAVTLRGSSRDMTLSTVTGRITVDARAAAAPLERARFESVTGDISFAGGVHRGGDVRFDSNGGAIELALRPNTGADLEASTIAGSISNRLTSSRPVRGRYGRGSELTTELGNGGARISVRTFKGAITLRRDGG